MSDKSRIRLPKAPARSQHHDFEFIFRAPLKDFFDSPQDIAPCLASSQGDGRTQQAQTGVLTRKRDQVELDREKRLKNHLSEPVTMERFGGLDAKAKAQVGERLQGPAKGIAALEGEVVASEVTSNASADGVQGIQVLYRRWGTLDHEQKRSVIEAVVETVMIGEHEIETHLHYPPSPPSSDDGDTMQKA